MNIKNIAAGLAREVGLIQLTRRMVAEAAGIPDGSFIAKAGCTFTELVDQLRSEGVGLDTPFDGSRLRATSPELRRLSLVGVALGLAREIGYQQVTRARVATRAGCAPSLVSHYLGSAEELAGVVMAAAIEAQDLDILAQGLAVNDDQAKAAPQHLKQLAALQLTR